MTYNEVASTTSATPAPAGIRLGIVRGISYGLFGPPDLFAGQMKNLGSTLARVYVYWNQVEPEPGRFDWTAVDAILDQLDPADELWVTVCSSSMWATRQPTSFLPPSPAKDPDQFDHFVRSLVARCAGRVDYWQCNNEPSNTDLLWAGTAQEYVDQLTVFSSAVRATAPEAKVVLGGCGYDVLSSETDGAARLFFDHVVEHGRDTFDLFSIHLYDDPARIPAHVETVRQMMRRHGYERPVVVGEYNGPTLFEFEKVEPLLQEVMMQAFAPDAEVSGEAPERRAMRMLYARSAELPDELRMFMDDCPPALARRRDRINCRQIVTRNVLALSAGVSRTACWNLAPEIPNYTDPYNMMGLLFGKLALMDYAGTELTVRHPAAETFRLLNRRLQGVSLVTRRKVEGRPDLFAFDLLREGHEPLQILWKNGDTFSGEDDPAELVTWDWPGKTPEVIDIFGTRIQVEAGSGTLELPLSVTPLIVTA